MLALVFSACSIPAAQSHKAQPTEAVILNVMTHDSFAASEGVIAQFEQLNNARLVFIKSGDTGAALNRAILSKNSPQADVFYGVDNTFLTRALAADIFAPYTPPLLTTIREEFRLDAENRVTPIDYGDVCINYDKNTFMEKKLPVPQSLQELTRPEYFGLLVVENPATSSPGLAFLLATIVEFGPQGYLDFWKALRANGAVVVNDWETAYYSNFSGSSGVGSQPMVVSYGSSPAAEVIFAEQALEEAPTASIIGPNTCYRQIEFAGILKGTSQGALAEKFINFLLGLSFQEDMPLQMFVFPVNPAAKLPDAFVKYIQVPPQPAQLDPAEIEKNREKWISSWNEVVLH